MSITRGGSEVSASDPVVQTFSPEKFVTFAGVGRIVEVLPVLYTPASSGTSSVSLVCVKRPASCESHGRRLNRPLRLHFVWSLLGEYVEVSTPPPKYGLVQVTLSLSLVNLLFDTLSAKCMSLDEYPASPATTRVT